jgi:hypothetical protein
VATESSFSPLPIVLHAIAIAAGIFLGITAMAAISPDLPSDDSEAGATAPASAGQVAADDPNSLFQAGPLSIAVDSVSDQLAAGDELNFVHITPSEVQTESSSDVAGFAADEIDPSAPQRLATLIAQQRKEVAGLEDFQFVDLRLNEQSEPEWYVQLALEIDPPRTYVAPLDALSVKPGG